MQVLKVINYLLEGLIVRLARSTGIVEDIGASFLNCMTDDAEFSMNFKSDEIVAYQTKIKMKLFNITT